MRSSAPPDDGLHAATVARRRNFDVSSALTTPRGRTARSIAGSFRRGGAASSAPRPARDAPPCSCCRSGTRTQDITGLCRLLARTGERTRLSLPTIAAAPNSAGRLHRQRQRRADRAGLPPGDPRRAARDHRGWRCGLRRIGILGTSLGSCLALLTAAHEPLIRLKRSITSRPTSPTSCGAASRPSTCAGSTPHREPTCCTLWAPTSPRGYPSGFATARRCWSTRIRPDVPARSLGGSYARSAISAFRTRSRCCAAALAPGARRSSSSTDGYSHAF